MSLTITNIVFVGISSLSPSIGAVRLNSIYHFVRRVDTYLRTRYHIFFHCLCWVTEFLQEGDDRRAHCRSTFFSTESYVTDRRVSSMPYSREEVAI
jgi:hypothetical protein